jgi:two-component system invasion response regulator UvrY
METTLPANREIKETMMVQPSILVADDHSMIRKGLKLHLQLTLGYTDITEVGNCNDLMKELVKKKYTHLILDVILSDGSTLEIIPNIIKVYPGLHILVFSMQPAEIYGEAMKQYGIHYYLSKSAGDEEIIQMLRKFLKNEAPVRRIQSVPKTENPFTTLSPRELEILHYVLKGMGTKKLPKTSI